ncbi:uncharacterized protein SPSK_06506 [Sporothrix schenckii 1099-18]|uniref:Uncharacterized protein n=1 Tax=Sporothrix schenckii 1099-18 TaxID=1397361 RepID=A0A0F2MLI7_SPOSC|nr:uncharacterized protein SPSK_06506 [Sporothrix schenckii 1099-18]KJR89929.1 hypothetical protein SPSK_06506 [Sporothrix schenckii 1099-18]
MPRTVAPKHGELSGSDRRGYRRNAWHNDRHLSRSRSKHTYSKDDSDDVDSEEESTKKTSMGFFSFFVHNLTAPQEKPDRRRSRARSPSALSYHAPVATAEYAPAAPRAAHAFAAGSAAPNAAAAALHTPPGTQVPACAVPASMIPPPTISRAPVRSIAQPRDNIPRHPAVATAPAHPAGGPVPANTGTTAGRTTATPPCSTPREEVDIVIHNLHTNAPGTSRAVRTKPMAVLLSHMMSIIGREGVLLHSVAATAHSITIVLEDGTLWTKRKGGFRDFVNELLAMEAVDGNGSVVTHDDHIMAH